MGTHHDAVQRAEILILAMVRALLNGTLDTLVGTIHLIFLLCLISNLVWPVFPKPFGEIL